MTREHYIVTAVGENRTGIVAEVSELIYKSGCNIEDSQMGRLADQFVLSILVSSKREEAARTLLARCNQLKTRHMQVVVFPLGECRPHCHHHPVPEPNYTLRAVGQDRAGIVCRTSRILAVEGVDIVDMTTHITRAPESGVPIFTMEAHLVVPPGTDPEALRRKFVDMADEMVIDMSLGLF
jgi:glycine cleavage system transcriptional repressor